MKLTLPTREEPVGQLLPEQGDFAGRLYLYKVSICPNPACDCKRITLLCVPETADVTAPLPLEMDLVKKMVRRPEQSPEEAVVRALAGAVRQEITDADWLELRRLYVGIKQNQSETADPDQIEASFPPEDVIEGATVGYYEILPYARPIELTVEGQTWFFDDQYCVKSKCGCSYAVMTWHPVRPEQERWDALDQKGVAIRYYYDKGTSEDLPPMDPDLPPSRVFLETMLKVQPDLNSFLEKRHALLRRLRERSLAAEPEPAAPVKRAKIGRNEPCPCGSGKKYKHCCLGKQAENAV